MVSEPLGPLHPVASAPNQDRILSPCSMAKGDSSGYRSVDMTYPKVGHTDLESQPMGVPRSISSYKATAEPEKLELLRQSVGM